ncbi:hypothetical protein LXL04_008525 [Taraxacum kok-saghyz]
MAFKCTAEGLRRNRPTKLVRQLQNQDGVVAREVDPATPKKNFQLLNQTIEALSYVPALELALRLYLQCVEAANDCDLEPVAYEIFTQAFVLYKEEIAMTRTKSRMEKGIVPIPIPIPIHIPIPILYLYYFEKGNPQITSGAIQGPIELIKTEMQSDTATSGSKH